MAMVDHVILMLPQTQPVVQEVPSATARSGAYDVTVKLGLSPWEVVFAAAFSPSRPSGCALAKREGRGEAKMGRLCKLQKFIQFFQERR